MPTGLRRALLTAVLLAALLAAPAEAGRDALVGALDGSPAEGSRLFASRGCIRCHAIEGEGGTIAPDLGRLALQRPLLELAGIMWNHSPRMEAIFAAEGVVRPEFTPVEMASVLAFVYSLKQADPPGDPAAGARLFDAKSCRTCHAVDGRGGRRGPALDDYGRYASPLFLTAALWEHGPSMTRVIRERGVPRPEYRGSDIADLVAYLRASNPGTARVYARPGDPARGEGLFTEKRCVECHAVRGEGGRGGPDLGAPGRLRGSLTQIAGAMWNHGPAMWAKVAERDLDVPPLTVEDLADVVSYLYFLQFIDRPGDPRRGQTVFDRNGCASCHALRGAGKDVGPPLAEVPALASPLALITAMWNHAGQMDETMLGEGLAWPSFRGTDVADLVAYVLSLREESATTGGAGRRAAPPR
jgi:mono/diheme cytochrome c family protein